MTINSSGSAMRSFCARCGTGLYYRNPELLPGVVEVALAPRDDPNAPAPTMHIHVVDRLAWMKHAHELPAFEQFPG